jgi:hypothetical protein
MEVDLSNISIAIVGIVKNAGKSLAQDVAEIGAAFADFKSLKWLLIESNSSDNTVRELRETSERVSDFNFISLGSVGVDSESRTIGMAMARNVYLEELRDNPVYKNIDYFVVADFNRSNKLLNRDAVRSCFARDDWDACTANQNGPYYDIWALRHELWQPNDCWRQLEFYKKYISFPEKALFMSVNSKMLRIPKNSLWIEVDSAFGGLAIYKSHLAKNARYSGISTQGYPICEHVPFHQEIRKSGNRIFINPQLINIGVNDHSQRISLFRAFLRVFHYPFRYLDRKWNMSK